jgi:hypothetical protein
MTRSSTIQPISASSVTGTAKEIAASRTSASGSRIENTMAGMPIKWVARLRSSR